MKLLLNRFIELLKWPIAIYYVGFFAACIQSLSYFNFANLKYLALFGGFFFFFIARGFMDSGMKTTMEILAHEMTHAFFALLTFHKVTGIRVAPDDSGGYMSFEGGETG
jgi:hypothetical protein